MFGCQCLQACNVIDMVMGEQYAFDKPDIASDLAKQLFSPTGAYTGINEQCAVMMPDIVAIAAAAAGKTTKFNGIQCAEEVQTDQRNLRKVIQSPGFFWNFAVIHYQSYDITRF